MKKLLIIIMIFLFPLVVKAETKTYEICQEGCEYDRLAPVIIDVNLLQDEYDVEINFKDEGPYYLIKDEQDYTTMLSRIEEECINNNGTWDGYDCINPESIIIGTSSMFFNSRLKSLTLNGVENKTKIFPTGIFSMSEFLNALTFSGILQTDFELNNLYFASSIYFTAVTKDVKGTINNCDIKHGILAYGNEYIEIKNSKINNVYAIGKDFAEENALITAEGKEMDIKNPTIIIDKQTTSFYKKFYKYTEDNMQEIFAELREFYDNNPEPKFSEPYPQIEDYQTEDAYWDAISIYWRNENQWNIEHQDEYKEWKKAKEQVIEKTSHKFYEYKGTSENWEATLLELIESISNDTTNLLEDYHNFEEKYMQEHPMPVIGTDEYDIWYQEYQKELDHHLINGSLLPTSGEIVMKLLSMIIFPGDDGSFSNVIEIGEGKIYLRTNNYKKLPIDKKSSINDIIKEIKEPIEKIEFSKNDIVKIEDDTIIPLKVGIVELRIQTKNEVIYLTIEVTEEMLNPKTKANITAVIIIILIISTVLFIVPKKNRLKNKV